MSGEPLAGVHSILIDHPERSDAHVRRIMVVAEGERVPGLKPAQIRDAALIATSGDEQWE
jgi:hypothetical protein